MAKARKSRAGGAKPRSLYALHPWRCEPRGDDCDIMAYVEASGRWEAVATIPATPGARADELGGFIVRLVNDSQEQGDVIHAALTALEAILEEGLTFTTEQEAERAIERLKAHGA
jgi:hypothetical protein